MVITRPRIVYLSSLILPYQQTLEKTEGTIKNGQSRDTGNIEHKTQNEDKQNKKHITENWKDEQHRSPNKTRVNPSTQEGRAVPVS